MTDAAEWERVRQAVTKHVDAHELLRAMTEDPRPSPETAAEAEWAAIVERGRGAYTGRLGDATVDVANTTPDTRSET